MPSTVESFADVLSFSDTTVASDADTVTQSDADVSGTSFADATGDSSANVDTLKECGGEALACCDRLLRFPTLTACRCVRSRCTTKNYHKDHSKHFFAKTVVH